MKTANRVRPARLADLDALQALEALFPSDAMSRRSLRRFVQAPNAIFLVAELAGQVQGNLLLLTRRDTLGARIYSLIVDPAARGRGLARCLVLAAESAAADRYCSGVSLEVRTDNTAARALYASLGYRPVKKLPGYYDDGVDGLRLGKRFA